MLHAPLQTDPARTRHTAPHGPECRVDVACPDARQPAYRAVAGLCGSGALKTFHTAYYHNPAHWLSRWIDRSWLPGSDRLARRFDREIPPFHVRACPSVDLAIALENRARSSAMRRRLAAWRVRRFDRLLARAVDRDSPDALLLFSDVGSELTLDACRRRGVPVVLSVVHGDPDEEVDILQREAELSPDYFGLYLGDGRLDLDELRWLHDRRKREAQHADRILVPSQHVAAGLMRRGIERERVEVIPYAADLERFRPVSRKHHKRTCHFVFAGGVTQRKGIKYLLDAWSRVYRPGWKLTLLGALPRRTGALACRLAQPGIRVAGAVAHSEMPARLAEGDVFLFPSLFEGSAVVTYEALACGLPSVVTPQAGSVVCDGEHGFVVPAADVDALAAAIERLGSDPDLRAQQATAARRRAEEFDWHRYCASVCEAVRAALTN